MCRADLKLLVFVGNFEPGGLEGVMLSVIGAVYMVFINVIIFCIFAHGSYYSFAKLLYRRKNETVIRYVWNVFLAPSFLMCAYVALYTIMEVSLGECVSGFVDLADILYFSLVTITTVGYGDFKPIGVCKYIAASQAYLGYIMFSVMSAAIYSEIAGGIDE